ncbi:hypothetical protein [Criblamydia sequanensis]|uniref:Uncharacterized protein n=1 Tax=Candidatus Criblamydia sequanensis CRIB-18 TaxID=1437425 RepID=A0A090CXQ8_9BACT|nr:hypothetical protein [Criblamydia sequanensis]CDR32882.1 hypothetical protein CSEC_0038 [Criblamydia sequanensis CRIB-18]
MVGTINPIKVICLANPTDRSEMGFLDTLAFMIHQVHGVYRFVVKADNYNNNFIETISGDCIEAKFGDQKIVQIASQAVAISATIAEAAKEKTKLQKTCEATFDAMTTPYLLPPKTKWEKQKGLSWLSPSTLNFLKKLGQTFINRIKRIVLSIFELFKRLFIFSMKLMDIKDAFSFTEHFARERVREFVLNFKKCLTALQENKQFLLSCLKAKEPFIAQILKQFGSVFTVDHLMKAVIKSIESVETITKGLKKANEVVKDVLGIAAVGIFNTMGILPWISNEWVAPMASSSEEANKYKDFRFPPKDWVQIPIKEKETASNTLLFAAAKEDKALDLLDETRIKLNKIQKSPIDPKKILK